MTDFRLSVSTRAVPKVYLSTDHQCIVWCKQLVLVQARFLFDMIDARSKQISPDWGKRTLAVGFHFRRNSGVSDGGIQKEPSRVKLGHPYAWREIHSQCWSLHDEKPSDTGVYFAIPVLSGTTFELIARTNTDREQWIFACRADVLDGGKCVGTAADLSHLAAIMPHYRVLHLSLKQLLAGGQQYTHIVMPVARGRMSDLLEVNLLSSSEKSFEVSVPHVFSNLWTLGQGATYTVPASRGCRNRFYYELHLKDFHSIYQSFHLRLNKQSSSSKSGAMVVTRTEVPWDVGQASFGGEDITVKIRATVNHTSPSFKVHVYDSSRNSLTFQLRVAFLAFLGQVVRNFGASLPVYVLANALLVFCHQLQQLRHSKPCHDVYAVHELVAKPYKIQPFISMTRFFFGYPLFVRLWQAVGLPVPDSLTAEESGVWFTFAPLLLFLYAFELFRFTLAVQRGIIAALQLLLPPTPFPPKFLAGDTSNAILARMAMHLLVLAMLLRQWSFYAFFYIFSVSFIRCSRLCGRVRPLTAAGKNDVNTVLMSSAGISSQSQSTADSSDSLYSANSTSDEDFDVYGGLKASDDENIVDSGKTQTSSSLTTSLSETSLDSTPVEHVAAGGDFVGAPGDLITQPSAQSACDDAAPPDSVSPVGDDDDQDDDDVERDIQYETANTADDEENSVESNDDNHPEDTDTLSKLSAANKTAENDCGATVCNQPDTTAPPNPFATPVKSLDPTSKLQDQFSVNFILLQLWLWLTLFSLPSVIAFEVNHRSSPFRPIDPWFVHATVASLLFSLPTPRGQWDGLARSKLRPITGFAVSVVVLMVVVSASSVYRAPAFMLAFLALHTFAQFV